MEKIFKIFGKEYINLNQAALLLGSFALLSQILGLLRDRMLAHFVGPGPTLDMYYAAFRLPDFLFISIASLVSITVIIPFLSSKMDGVKITQKAQDFLNQIFTVFLFVMVLVSLGLFWFMPYLVKYIAPGFPLESQIEVAGLSRVMLLSPIMLGLSNLFGVVTQFFRRFFLYSLSPVFYNLGILFGIIFLYPNLGVLGLAIGVGVGAVAHFLVQYFSSRHLGFNIKFTLNIDWAQMRQVLYTSLPRTIGLSMNNIALVAIIALASYFDSGSISIFNLSLNLQAVPLNIIGISYAVAAFPTLAKSFSTGEKEEFKNQLRKAARAIVFWSLPVTFIFIVIRAQIVRVILGSSSFSWEDTRLVAASLAVFSVSMLAQGMIALVSRAYYAKGETIRPLLVNTISSASIIFFAYFLTNIFSTSTTFRYFIEAILKVEDIPGTEVLMLPLAYSLGTIINFIIHWYFAKREFMRGESFISKTFLQSLGASFFLGFVSYSSLNFFSPIFGTSTFIGVFLQGFISAIFGVLAGFGVLYLLKSQELHELIQTLKTKFWKTKVIAPSQEGL